MKVQLKDLKMKQKFEKKLILHGIDILNVLHHWILAVSSCSWSGGNNISPQEVGRLSYSDPKGICQGLLYPFFA